MADSNSETQNKQTTPNTDPKPETTPKVEPKKDDKEENLKALREAKKLSDKKTKELEAELEKIKSEQKKADEERLAEEGKYKDLYEEKVKEIDELKSNNLSIKESQLMRDKLTESGVQSKWSKSVELQLREAGVKLGDDGELENFDAAMDNIKKSLPEVFDNVPSGSVGTTGAGASAGGVSHDVTLKGSELSQLTPDQYSARADEINKAMNENRVDWNQ